MYISNTLQGNCLGNIEQTCRNHTSKKSECVKKQEDTTEK